MGFECEVCHEDLKTSSSYYRHMREQHDGISRIPCQACNMTFLNKANYQTHLTRNIHKKNVAKKAAMDLVAAMNAARTESEKPKRGRKTVSEKNPVNSLNKVSTNAKERPKRDRKPKSVSNVVVGVEG